MRKRLLAVLGLMVQPALAQDSTQVLVARAARQFGQIPGYHCRLEFFQRNGERTARGLYDVTGKPPRQLRLEILEGEGKGTRLYWDGSPKVKVRPGGWLSPLVVKLPLADERLKGIRGYTIDQTELGHFFDLLEDPRGTLEPLATEGGVLKLASRGPHLPAGCTRLTMDLGAADLLPQGVCLYEGPTLVFQLKLRELRLTPEVSFDL